MNSLRDRRPISINKHFHPEYERLKWESGSDFSDKPFSDFREIFLLSAVTGVLNDAFQELDKNKVKIFDSNVFSETEDLPVIWGLAFSKEKNAELLADDQYVLSIIEGYANAGFPLLLEKIENIEFDNNLLNLANYVKQYS